MKMFSSLFPVPIPPFFCSLETITPPKNTMDICLGILLMLAPFLVIMVLESRWRVDHDEEDEEVGFGGFEKLGEEEEYRGEE